MTSIHLVNYRCFADVTVKLGPLTVLVGPNASGKTSLLTALGPVPAGIRPQGAAVMVRPNDYRNHDPSQGLQVQQYFDGSLGAFMVQPPMGPVEVKNFEFATQLIHFDPASMRGAIQLNAETALNRPGQNIANVFATLPRKEQEKVSELLCQLAPAYKDVDERPTMGGLHQLYFQDRWSGVWYEPAEVSDGTFFLLGFILLQFQAQPPDMILVDEAERGIHPWLLGELVGLFRKLSRAELGPKAIQVVLATHSAELLDQLEPTEVRFLTRDRRTGAVSVEEVPADQAGWRDAYRTYDESLGSLWLAGGLGGVPGR